MRFLLSLYLYLEQVCGTAITHIDLQLNEHSIYMFSLTVVLSVSHRNVLVHLNIVILLPLQLTKVLEVQEEGLFFIGKAQDRGSRACLVMMMVATNMILKKR